MTLNSQTFSPSRLTFLDIFKQQLLLCYGETVANNSDLIYMVYIAQGHSFYGRGFRFMTYKRINKYMKSPEFIAMNMGQSLFYIRGYKRKIFTRGFKPTNKLIKCVNNSISLYLEPENDHFLAENDQKTTKINSIRKDGGRSTFEAIVTNSCRVDVTGLKEILEKLHGELVLLQQYARNNIHRGDLFMATIHQRIEQVTSHRNHALELYNQATDKSLIAWGFVPLQYQQVSTGRVYAKGVSLQNAPRAIRAAALGNCYEYDVENCHYEFLRQKAGTHLPYIQQYCANKAQVRALLADKLNLPVKTIKTILLSLIYGANAHVYLPEREGKDASAISEACGNADTFYRVIDNPIIKGIRDEIKSAANILIHQYTHNGRLTNAMRIYYTGDNKWSKQLAHVLQGLEAKALEAVANITGSDTMLLLHDGIYTTSQWNKKALSQAILAATGCKITVSEESTLTNQMAQGESATPLDSKGLDENMYSGTKWLDIGVCGQVPLGMCVDNYESLNTSSSRGVNLHHTEQIPPTTEQIPANQENFASNYA